MSRWCSIVPAVFPLLLVAACVDVEPELGATEQLQSCPKSWGCGENSPVIGPWNFHELNQDHRPNAEGVTLLGLWKNDVPYQVEVKGAQMFAKHLDGTVLSGAQLDGSYLVVTTADGNKAKIHIVKVSPQATSQTTFWVGPPTRIETYELEYQLDDGDYTPLCNNPPGRESYEGPGRLYARPLEAILFTGDRYDATAKKVTETGRATAGWFNIACASSAIAKLELTRHTEHGKLAAYPSDRGTRQAMLKMYTSDLCGRGATFTAKGTPLHWQNTLGWSVLTGAEYAHEAYWNQDGAVCLDTHRRFTEYLPEIAAECADAGHPLPTCAGTTIPPGSYLSSAVPFATLP